GWRRPAARWRCRRQRRRPAPARAWAAAAAGPRAPRARLRPAWDAVRRPAVPPARAPRPAPAASRPGAVPAPAPAPPPGAAANARPPAPRPAPPARRPATAAATRPASPSSPGERPTPPAGARRGGSVRDARRLCKPQEKKGRPWAPLLRASGAGARSAAGDHAGHLQALVGIAPLVVVPGHQLDEGRIQLDAGVGVEDRGARVATE